MAITLNGTTGITTPDIDTDGLSVEVPNNTSGPFFRNLGTASAVTDSIIGVIQSVNRDASLSITSASTNSSVINLGAPGTDFHGRFIYSNASNSLSISTNNAERARIDANGNLCVGINFSNSRIRVNKDDANSFSNANLELVGNGGALVLGFHAAGASAVCLDHIRGGGSVRCVNGGRTAFAPLEASAFTVNSDYRLKENVQSLTHALERLAQIPVHRFSFIKDSMSYADGAIVDGFIAHEVQAVVPEAITGTKDAVETVDVTDEEGKVIGTEVKPVHQGIDQSKLVPLLTAAIQEQQTLIQALTARIEALEQA